LYEAPRFGESVLTTPTLSWCFVKAAAVSVKDFLKNTQTPKEKIMSSKPDTLYYEYGKKIKRETIPFYEPWLGDEELAQVAECIRNNWISEGEKTREFEERIAEMHCRKYALAVVNCTSALMMGFKALGIGKGDEVIGPAYTFISSINSIRLVGATPILVDVNPKTCTINVDALEMAITPRTKAILPVHLGGHPVDMDKVLSIVKKYNLHLIEDAAQSMGSMYKNKPVGAFGDVSCLSFFANKTITTGEGGVIMTDSDELYKELLMLKNDGRPERGAFLFPIVGYNFRTTDLQSAVGLAQLDKLPRIIAGKLRILKKYKRHLESVNGIEFAADDPNCYVVPHHVGIIIDDPEGLEKYLYEQGIGSRRFYPPIHKQPCYNMPDSFPIAEDMYARGLYLPSAPTMTDEEIDTVCEKIKFYIKSFSRSTD